MTQNLQIEYLELITALKNYIGQEFSPTSAVVANPETLGYFKQQAQKSKVLASQKGLSTPAPLSTPTPPSLAASGPATIKNTPTPNPSTPNNLPLEALAAPSPYIVEQPTAYEVKAPEKIKQSPTLKREALEASKSKDFSDLCKLWEENYPHSPIIKVIPSDARAKEICQRWQHPAAIPEVALLYYNENEHEKAFLSNLAAAISLYFVPAGLVAAPKIESEKNWHKFLSSPLLKIVISPHHSLYKLPELTKLYSEDPVRGNHTLGRTPVLLLSDISLYMQEPKLKIALWQTLCQRFAAIR